MNDHRPCVDANDKLAESRCDVRLINLTVERARQLIAIHARHAPDTCNVHLVAAVKLLRFR